MAPKVMLAILTVIMFSLGTMPAPTTAARFDIANLLAAINIPDGKAGDSSWCDNCVCTKSFPPYCRCSVATLCPICVCSLTVPPPVKPFCESLDIQFISFCPSTVTATH